MSAILVYALHYEGEFNKNSLGAVSEGAKLAKELGGECAAVVVGDRDDLTDDLCASLGRYGATKVFRAKAPAGLAQPVVDVMAKVVQDNGFKYALFGGGLLGFEIGAGLTARLNAGVTMEVTAVKVRDGGLVAERPILQDSAVVDVGYVGEPGIIIGRLNAFDIAEGGDGAAEVVAVDVQLEEHSTKAKMVQRGEQRGADVNIEDAEILVAGGRGLGKAEGFELAEALAEALGGAVAATRAVVDAGWYPYAAQIGQTGKTVAPKLYLAAGISGAIQHKVGMQSSENIVAINKDPNAPIFEFSDVGVAIVGGGQAGLACAIRLLQLLADDPELTERLGEVPVAVLEKGKVAGAHQLSGAVMNPSAIRELVPDDDSWPSYGPVEGESVYFMLNRKRAVPLKPIPPPFRNHGNYVVALADLNRWLAERAEEAGAYLLSG